MAGIPESVATNIVQRLVDRAIDEAYYLCCFKKIVGDFEEQKKILVAKLTDVQKDIEDNKKAVKETREEDKVWVNRANGLIAEVTKTKKSSFYGWCRNCIWQYRQGKDLAEKAQKIKALVEKSNLAKTGRPVDLPGLEYYASPDFVHFDSRKLVYGKLLEALKNGESYIALQGMGGSGKTTMVIKVGEKVEKEKLFDKVILVVVSNNPDVKKIQDEIARPLGLEFKQEENDLERAKKLWLRLTNGEKILIILDDVWEKLKFEDIGIPRDHNHKGCRVLLTTRNLNVCRLMGCQDSTIQLDILSEHEAWDFFKKHSGINDNSSKKLKDTAEKIAKECKRLPVALAAVASTLKNQPLEDWNAALKSLRNPRPIDITDLELKEVYRSLKVSYDFLNNEHAQELFKLCSLSPEDYEIPLEDLTRFAIGLGLFGEIDSYTTARDDMHRANKRLIESCLLMEVDEGRYVKMHDLVRDVAKLIANNEIQLIVGPRWNLGNIEKQRAIRYLYCQNMIDFPERLSCPKLEILLVSIDKEDSLEVPKAFFEGMIDLKVLALWRRDWWSRSTLKLPRSIELLEGLRTLRLTNSKFEDISVLKKLQRLETLELIRCLINELPNEIRELEKLRLLKLEDCEIKRNPFKVIGRLFQIEELHFVRNFGPNWEFTSGIVADLFYKDSISPKLQRYRISLENPANDFDHFRITDSVSKGVGIEQFLIDSILNTTIKHMIQRAEYLGLKKIQGGYKSVVPALVEAIGGDMNELTQLVLYTYFGMEYLIDTSGRPSLIGTIFSKLIKLQLKEMCDLKELCHGHQTPPDLFEKLQSLEIHGCSKLRSRLLVRNLNLRRLEKLDVRDCPKLTSLFTFSTAQSLVELKQLRITECKELKYIITEDKEEREEIVQDQNEDCPKARQHDNNTSSIITDGGNYQNHKNNSCIFPKLEEIEVENCSVLEFIFPASFSGNLPHLKSISIHDAPELKYVFGQYHHEDNLSHQNDNLEIQIHLPALESIILWDLPKIISICPNNFSATWTSLKLVLCSMLRSITSIWDLWDLWDFLVPYDTMQQDHIITEGLQISNSQQLCSSQYILRQSSSFCNIIKMIISGCPKLTSLFTLSVASTIMLEELTIRDCHGMKQIITDGGDYQNHKNNSSIFPKLRRLWVYCCSVLEFIFPVSCSGNLLHLQCICIEAAPKLKYVFGQYHHGDNLSHQNENLEIKIDLPALEDLYLNNLPKIISICPNNFYATCPSLKSFECSELSIASICDFLVPYDAMQQDHIITEVVLPNLEKLNLHGLDHLTNICKDPCISLQMLKSLELLGCDNFKYLFSFPVTKGLLHLQELRIIGCKSIKEILVIESGAATADATNEIVLGKVNNLTFENLPELYSFCSNGHHVKWPSLQKVRVVKCPKIQPLSLGTLDKSNLEVEVEVEVEECPWQDEADPTSSIEYLFHLPDFAATELVLDIKNSEGLRSLETDRCSFLSKTMKLSASNCDGRLTEFLSELLPMFYKLQHLEVKQCELLMQVFNLQELVADENGNGKYLTWLKTIKLRDLPKLSCIWNKDPTGVLGLINLVEMEIVNCGFLRSICSTSLAQQLWKLKVLKIHSCPTVEEVVALHSEEKTGVREIVLPRLQNLELVHLQNFRRLHKGNYIFRFPSLQSLTIEDCPRMDSFSSRFLSAESPTVADEKSKETLGRVTVTYPKMKKLKLVSLHQFDEICQGFISPGSFSELKEVEMNTLGKLKYVIASNTLPMLQNLEKLSVNNCDSLTEVFQLNEEFDFDSSMFPTPSTLLLSCLPKLQHIIKIESGGARIFEYLQILQVKNCHGLQHLLLPSSCLNKLKQLEISECDVLEEIFLTERGRKMDETHLESILLEKLTNLSTFYLGTLKFPSLLEARIIDCPKLTMFPSGIHAMENLSAAANRFFINQVAYPKMKKLKLVSLHQFDEIWQGSIFPGSFSELKEVEVNTLGKLKYVFASNTLPMLQNLEKLSVKNCDGLQRLLLPSGKLTKLKISECDVLEEILLTERGREMDETHLKSIFLKKLTNLSTFCLGTLKFPSLLEATIIDCPKLTTFPSGSAANYFFTNQDSFNKLQKLHIEKVNDCQKIWNDELPPVASEVEKGFLPQLEELALIDLPVMQLWKQDPRISVFKNLKLLEIIDCKSLKKLFTVSTAKNLEQLELLKLYGCKEMDQILEGEEGSTETLEFPNLKCIILKHLERLTCFGGQDCEIKFPALEIIRVKNIPKMETFAKGSAPNLKEVHVTYVTKCWKGELNKTIKYLHDNPGFLKMRAIDTGTAKIKNVSVGVGTRKREHMSWFKALKMCCFKAELPSPSRCTQEETYDLQTPQVTSVDVPLSATMVPTTSQVILVDSTSSQESVHIGVDGLSVPSEKVSPISGSSRIEGMYAQSKDEHTNAETNKASPPDTGFVSDQNKQNALVGQSDDSNAFGQGSNIEDQGNEGVSSASGHQGTDVDSGHKDTVVDHGSKDSNHDHEGAILDDSNEMVDSGQGVMDIDASAIVVPLSGEIDAAIDVCSKDPASKVALSGSGTPLVSVCASLSTPHASVDSSITTTSPNAQCTKEVTFPLELPCGPSHITSGTHLSEIQTTIPLEFDLHTPQKETPKVEGLPLEVALNPKGSSSTSMERGRHAAETSKGGFSDFTEILTSTVDATSSQDSIPLPIETIKKTMDQEGSKLENAMLKKLSPQELAKKESMNETLSKDQQGLREMRSEIHSNDSKNDKQSKVELVQEESRKYTSMTEQQSIKGNVQGDSTPEKDKKVIKETEKKNLQEYSASEKPAMATSSTPSLSPSATSSNEVIEATTVTLSTALEPRKPYAEPLVFPQVHASATTASTRTDREILLIESKQNCADAEAIAQSKDTQEERTHPQVSERRATEESVTEESTQIEDNMEAFYASIETDSSALPLAENTSTNIEPVNIRPSEETQKALQILQDLVSKKFSLLLHPGRTGFMKNVLDYLLSLSPEDGISLRMKFVILQLSKSFSQWSLDYSDASFKLESATAYLSSIAKLEEGLEANVKEFREAETLENGACSKLAYLEGRKRELEDEINAIKGEIADCKLVRDTAAERKRPVFDSGRMLKSQKDDLKNRVPRLKDEQEWAKLTQANIESEWSKLAHQFIESSSFGE